MKEDRIGRWIVDLVIPIHQLIYCGLLKSVQKVMPEQPLTGSVKCIDRYLDVLVQSDIFLPYRQILPPKHYHYA